MPRLDGFALCKNLRAAGLITPVLMLTAQSHAEEVTGLKIGADDYVTKPFKMPELVALSARSCGVSRRRKIRRRRSTSSAACAWICVAPK